MCLLVCVVNECELFACVKKSMCVYLFVLKREYVCVYLFVLRMTAYNQLLVLRDVCV